MRAAYRGNTPACAGKRHASTHAPHPQRKYPRVRGEEPCARGSARVRAEIPPRARGREWEETAYATRAGNTPACAGKSGATSTQAKSLRKYPRVRGEEAPYDCGSCESQEIPPRARGRAQSLLSRRLAGRNTPACAGKRVMGFLDWLSRRKYPRVRGEESSAPSSSDRAEEIPPRARGRDSQPVRSDITKGNTPACAGKRGCKPSAP